MFKDRDIICFLGDSITANGTWMAEIYQRIRKLHRIKCYNCGVSGSTARGAVKYMHYNCLSFNPDYVVVMFGINDIARERYALSKLDNEDDKRVRDSAKVLHKEKYLEVIDNILKSGATPILCTPVPYDEISEGSTEVLYCQSVMDELADFVRALARDRGYALVDFTDTMKQMLGKRAIISPDRVHPTGLGHHVMAQIFLRDLGFVDECDFDTPFVFEEWNKERYAAEQRIHKLKFVEFCSLLEAGWAAGTPMEQRKALALEKYNATADKNSFPALAYLDYIDNIDSYPRYVAEIVRLTSFE